MKYAFRYFPRLVLCVLMLADVCWGERGVLFVHVVDINNQPVPAVELAIQNMPGSGATDDLGRARIKLASGTMTKAWIALEIVHSPAGQSLVIVSPWDAHAQVPSFYNESKGFLTVVVAGRGDRALLENGKALSALAARIARANSPEALEGVEGRREPLEAAARAFGLPPDEVDKALRAWGENTSDPYGRGLANLYKESYPQAGKELSQALKMREKKLPPDQAAIADAAAFLAQARYQELKFPAAVSAYRLAFRLRPYDSALMNNVAGSLWATRHFKGAESWYRRALAHDEKTVPANHLDVVRDLLNLAWLAVHLDDYPRAEALYRRALATDEKALGPEHPRAARDLTKLAELLESAGSKSAEPLYRRALAIDEKALGPEHFRVGEDLDHLASWMVERGDVAGAEPLYRRSLAIAEKIGGPDDPSVGISLNNLALLLTAKHDYAAAEPLYRRSLAITEKVYGPGDHRVAMQMYSLALALQHKGDYEEAESLFRSAVELDSKALGPNNTETLMIESMLVELLRLKENKASPPQ